MKRITKEKLEFIVEVIFGGIIIIGCFWVIKFGAEIFG